MIARKQDTLLEKQGGVQYGHIRSIICILFLQREV